MTKSITTALLLMIAYGDPALAVTSEELAKEKDCFVCHDVKLQKFAPSFTDISRRFSGLSNAKPMLVRVVKAGTDSSPATFHWGSSKMPPDTIRAPVSDAEAEVLVDYVLSFH